MCSLHDLPLCLSNIRPFLVNTLTLAKPEKGRQAEAMLLQMAQTGQVKNQAFELSSISKPVSADLALVKDCLF